MNQEPDQKKGDVYSAGERAMMERTQRARGWLLAPMLRVLARAGVTPDHLTFASLLAGLAFCPLYFWSPPLAFTALALHILLDGLDGPLARHLGTASQSGSFTDTMADQTVIAATAITLMYTGMIGIAPGAMYIVIYTVVALFAMARNMLEVPYAWLIRPRFFVYAWFLVETYLWRGSINVFLWICIAFLTVKMLSGFNRIRKHI